MAGKPATHNKHRHAAAAVVKQQPAGEAVETSTLDCLSVDEFCRRNSLSTQYFYKAPEEMPPSFRLGASSNYAGSGRALASGAGC